MLGGVRRMQKKLGMGKEKRGITLLALVITVIILVILAGVGISAINSGNIFGNATNVVEQSKIASKKEEIELVIISKMNASITKTTILIIKAINVIPLLFPIISNTSYIFLTVLPIF